MSIKDSSYCIENDRVRQFELADIERCKNLINEQNIEPYIKREKLYLLLVNKLMICKPCKYSGECCNNCPQNPNDLLKQIKEL